MPESALAKKLKLNAGARAAIINAAVGLNPDCPRGMIDRHRTYAYPGPITGLGKHPDGLYSTIGQP